MKLEFTKENQLNRITCRYPYLFPLGVSPQRLKEISNEIAKQPLGNLIVYSPKDELKPVALSLILRDKPKSFLMMNVYRVVDIFLQQDPEYTALSHLNQSHLLIYTGYDEMTNQRLTDLLFQLLQYRSNLVTYIFVKGNNPVNQTIMNHVKYPKVTLGSKRVVEEVF